MSVNWVNLPPEIGILISDHLSTANIITIRRVSHSWWEYWGKILNVLLKYRDRIFLDTHLHDSRVFNGQLDDPILQQFEENVLQQDATQHGRYHTIAFCPYGDEEYDSERVRFERTYHSGRVAWTSFNSVHIITLCTGDIKRYLNSGYEEVGSVWLHRDIVVVQALK